MRRLKIYVVILLLFTYGFAEEVKNEASPGKGFGSFQLGSNIDKVIGNLNGLSFQKYSVQGSVFKNIFKLNLQDVIVYDTIVSVKSIGLTFFFEKKILSGIIYKGREVEISGENKIESSLEKVRFVFGNSKAVLFRSKTGVLLIYLEYGIAFVDDPSDGIVDSVIIFNKKMF